MKYINVVLVSMFFLCLSCSNPKDPSDANFKNAINEYLTQSPLCIGNYLMNFPREFERDSMFNEQSIADFDEFVKVGFLSKSEEKRKKLNYKKEEIEVTFFKYDLTELGKQNFTKNKGFCYGTSKVAEIVNFSEPSSAFGHTLSTVNYTYVTTVDDWVEKTIFKKKSSIQKAINSVKKPINDSTQMILTNKGWIHERLFKKQS